MSNVVSTSKFLSLVLRHRPDAIGLTLDDAGWVDIDELIRLVEALQFTDQHGEVCPAGWNKGDKGMNASPDGVAAYLSEHAAAL